MNPTKTYIRVLKIKPHLSFVLLHRLQGFITTVPNHGSLARRVKNLFLQFQELKLSNITRTCSVSTTLATPISNEKFDNILDKTTSL